MHLLFLTIIELHTDVSSQGMGAMLNVQTDEQTYSLAFYSRQLHGPEKRYSVTES